MILTAIKAILNWFGFGKSDLSNFIVTDYAILKPYEQAVKMNDESKDDADAYDTMVANCTRLRRYGAVVNMDDWGNFTPLNKVSGMPLSNEAKDSGYRTPDSLVGKKNVGLLMWGSPHPCISSHEDVDYSWNGTLYYDHTPKTEAFETMMWSAPDAIIIMTFSTIYRCEFYQPQWHENSTKRNLIVAKAYMRKYMPMRSSNISISTISESDEIMVAMAIPFKYMKLVTYTEDGMVDFSITLKKFLKAIKNEKMFGIALGSYAANLEVEATL